MPYKGTVCIRRYEEPDIHARKRMLDVITFGHRPVNSYRKVIGMHVDTVLLYNREDPLAMREAKAHADTLPGKQCTLEEIV